MLIPFVIFTAIIGYFSKSLLAYYRLWMKAERIPGPPAWPIFGNILFFWDKSPADIFLTVFQIMEQYGTVVRVWLGTKLNILLTDPKDAEAFLISQVYIQKGDNYKELAPWLNSGLLLSTGKKWHQRRKVITPAFHFKILEQFVEIFEKQSITFIDILSKKQNLNCIDLHPLISSYALDVICETAMGTVMDAQRDSNSEYIQAVKEVSHIINIRFFNIFLQSDFLFKFSSYGRRHEKLLEILHNFTKNVIRKRRQEIESNENKSVVDVDEFGTKKKQALLDVLLKSTIDGKPLTDDDIREEVDTFMFEGHDTTTAGINFTLYNIAKYPEVQEKCYQEVIRVLGKENDKQASYSDFSELNYLEKVIKETLRLYPPVSAVQRRLNEDVHINGKLYPSDVNITIHFYAMGRSPKNFKDPNEFRPERFDSENLKEFDTFAYLPFSAGPRNCIGQKFAMMEMKSIVAKILKHFHLSLIDDKELVLRSEIILKPDAPIMYCVKERLC